MTVEIERSKRDSMGFPLAWRGTVTTVIAADTIINDTLDHNGAEIDCRMASQVLCFFDLRQTGVTTSVAIEAVMQFRMDGDLTTWYEYRIGESNYLSWAAAEIAAATGARIRDVVPIPAAGDYMRIVLRATGTDANKTFTITVKMQPVRW